MRQNKKFRPSKRYVFATQENKDKLFELSKTKTSKELAKIFGCSQRAVNTNLIKVTGKRKYKTYKRRSGTPVCPILQANKIVNELGYKSSSDYISDRGKWDFIENVKPKLQA